MKKSNIFENVISFKEKYPSTMAFRIKSHCGVISRHIDEDEEVLYSFVGQKNHGELAPFNTFVFVITNNRLLLAKKRMLFGYFFYSVTPDMLNDITVKSGILWGKIIIDTVKEVITISNLSKDSLDEIETAFNKYMMSRKKDLNK